MDEDDTGDTPTPLSDTPFSNNQVTNNALPQFKDLTFTHARMDYPGLVLKIILLIYLVIALLALAGGLLFAPGLITSASTGTGMFISLPIIFLMALSAWHSYVWHKLVSYAIREHDIVLRSGVFWRSEVIQPLKRLQHVELTQGPIEKRYNLSKLKLFSAGTINSTFVIPGLDYQNGARIREYVLSYSDKVVDGREYADSNGQQENE